MPRLIELVRGAVDVPPSPVQAVPQPDRAGQGNTDSVSYRRLGGATTPQGMTSDPGFRGTDWYRLAEIELGRVAATIRDGNPPDIERAKGVAAGLVESLLDGDHLLIRAMSPRGSMPIVANMVNVAILATRMAVGLGWPRKDLEEMALAGLLHDIGMFRLPDSLIAGARPLSPEEGVLLREHPVLGCEIMRTLGTEYEWLAQTVLQEHERWQGGGYPKGLKADQIIEYACIIGIADVFDALKSARPYRRRLSPHEAVREILNTEQGSFPSRIVKSLIHEIGPFPVGMVVRLNTGEVCVVKDPTAGQPLRPLVEVYSRTGSEPNREMRLLDLARLPLIHIVESLELEGPPSS